MERVISNGFSIEEYGLEHRVEKIRKRMMKSQESKEDNDKEELIMIDVIQRLGLEDYFKEDIHVILQKHYAKFSRFEDDYDLYEVALRFRLFRQGRYHVTADIFNEFKDSDGRFKQELESDVKGLLSLYEASEVSIKGEDILDEASKFSAKLLKIHTTTTTKSNAQIIEHTLKNPHHKNLARLVAKSMLEDFEVPIHFLHDSSISNDWIKDLAKFDFDLAQTSHRNSIQHLSRWGEELDLVKELEFARVVPTKWYMWALGTFTVPSMSEEREELAKAVAFIYIIDDVFDVYGTPEDLTLFTKAVNRTHRWGNADTDKLPNYMKVCFNALQKQTNDFCYKIQQKYDWNPEDTMRKLWADLCNVFLVETKWSSAKHMPSSEEYLRNGIVSSGIHVVLAHAFFLSGQGLNNKTVHELNSLPSIISSAAAIVRLWNDVGTDKNENRVGHDLSYLDCYMNEHEGCSYEIARQHVMQMISESWKRIHEEYMSHASLFSMGFKLACLNFARMVPIVYSPDKSHHLQCVMKILDATRDEN